MAAWSHRKPRGYRPGPERGLNRTMPATDVYFSIRALLDRHGVGYRALEHEPTPTSEDSARVRGEPLAIGGRPRACGPTERMCSCSARRGGSTQAVSQGHRGGFLLDPGGADACGLVPGSVPPFGRPVLPFALYLDASMHAVPHRLQRGSLRRSVIMDRSDYQRRESGGHRGRDHASGDVTVRGGPAGAGCLAVVCSPHG